MGHMTALRVVAASMALAGGLAGTALANDDVLRISRDPANVVMPSLTYNGWNYSALDQISIGNVKSLSLFWTAQIGILDSHETSPLVIGNTMYVVSPNPNFIYAFDLVSEGVIKWEYRPTVGALSPAAKTCCGAPPRGLYYAESKIFFGTADGHVIALDAASGQQMWSSVAGDSARGEGTAGTGLVIGKNFIVGTGGDGNRGKVRAFDLNTGATAWTMFNMGPNTDVGIGAKFQKNYPYMSGANPALDSWYGESWMRGGGGALGFFTYDPDLNIFYYATGSCSPRNPDYRREMGKVDLDAAGHLNTFHNNFCDSQMARDATTGELVWAYNLMPQDMWGVDEPAVAPLIDIDIGGKAAKAAVKAAGNGLFYVWDRATGRLAAEPWMHTFQDVIQGPGFVDMQTGLPAYDIKKIPFTTVDDRRRYTPADPAAERKPADYTGTEVVSCPGSGARKWENDAYSPRTKLVYAHTNNSCAATTVVAGEYKPGEGYSLVRRANVAVPRKDVGGQATTVLSELKAFDPVNRKIAWSRPMGDDSRTPHLVTAGDLLFKGNSATGAVEGYDARTGEPVWSFRSGSGFAQSPISYMFKGAQYVAVVASSAAVNTPLAVNAAADNAARFRRSGTALYVFCILASCSP